MQLIYSCTDCKWVPSSIHWELIRSATHLRQETSICEIMGGPGTEEWVHLQVVWGLYKEINFLTTSSSPLWCREVGCSPESVGRYLYANRSIDPGEVIYREPALVVLPHSRPVCICCLKDVFATGDANQHDCPQCSMPVCSQKCGQIHQNHRQSRLLSIVCILGAAQKWSHHNKSKDYE